jgi:hypothetical protein
VKASTETTAPSQQTPRDEATYDLSVAAFLLRANVQLLDEAEKNPRFIASRKRLGFWKKGERSEVKP